MKNISYAVLAREGGVSLEEARRVWSRLELSGFRSWKPWALLLSCQIASWWMLLADPGAHQGFGARFLQSLLFMAGLLGSLAWSRHLAYPRMVEEARRHAEAERIGSDPVVR